MLTIIWLLLLPLVTSYEIICPDVSQKRFRATLYCPQTSEDYYSCLYDRNKNTYLENCFTPDYVRPGQRYIFSGKPKNFNCSDGRYQPFKFWSNGTGKCVFQKSLCQEEGQFLYLSGTTIDDNTCGCDYTQGYAFQNKPSDKCFCKPTVEDCSCILKICQNNSHLSSDYQCASNKITSSDSTCLFVPIRNYNGNTTERARFSTNDEKFDLFERSKPNLSPSLLVIFVIVAYIGSIAVLVYVTYTKENKEIPKTTEMEENDKTRFRHKGDKSEESTRKVPPDDAIKQLRTIFESVVKFLNMEEFDKDLRHELSTACPNYMTVLESAKRDLIRNDCGIVVTGETSAGKTTLINQVTGHDVFVTSNLAATGRVCRIRNSNTLQIKTYTKDEVLKREEHFENITHLKKAIRTLTDINKIESNEKDVFFVDVFLPVPMLKGNVIIVDTPGIGDSADLNQILMDFLPNAVSFIFVVNASNAGGIHESGISSILQAVMSNRQKMPCFDPREVIFLTNKWDSIENDDASDEEDNEFTKTWKLIESKLLTQWPILATDRIFKVSLKQVKQGKKGEFTEEYAKFEDALYGTIEKNKNRRVAFYFNFLRQFIQNALRGTKARLNLLEASDEEIQQTIHNNRKKLKEIEKKCIQSKDILKSYATEVIDTLVEKLHDYLHSDKGKEEILNTKMKRISVVYSDLEMAISFKIRNGILKWCHGKEVKEIIKQAEAKIRSFATDIDESLQDIDTTLTGITWARTLSGVLFEATGLILTGVLPVIIYKAVTMRKMTRDEIINKIYFERLKTISNDEIRKSFEKTLLADYDKAIVYIFEDSIPKVLQSYTETNEKLLDDHQLIRERHEEFMKLKRMVHQIENEILDFRKITDVRL